MPSSIRRTQLEDGVESFDHVRLHRFHGLENAHASVLNRVQQWRGLEDGKHSPVLLLQRVAADDVLRGGGGAAVNDAGELLFQNGVAVLAGVVLRLANEQDVAATLNASNHSVIHIHPSLPIQTIMTERDLRYLDQRLLVDGVEVVGQLRRSLQRDILLLSLADVVLHETLQTRAVTQRVVLPSVDLLLARVLSLLRPLMVL